MNEVTKLIILSLLESAKRRIETGEQSEAVKRIDVAMLVVENEGIAIADDKLDEKPPLPGEGSNGPL